MTTNEIKLHNAFIKLQNKKEQKEYAEYILKVFPGYTAKKNLEKAQKELEEAEEEYKEIFDLVYPDPEED